MKFFFTFVLSLFIVTDMRCQESSQLRYENDFLPPSFHQKKRDELRKQMPDSSVAILFSSPEKVRSNDTYYSYHQNPNFYYLTGFAFPNAVLMIFKLPFKTGGIETSEVLFIAPEDKESEVWHGKKATTEEAKSISGINDVFTTDHFSSFTISNNDFKSFLYAGLPSCVVDARGDSVDLFDLVNIFKSKFAIPATNGDTYLLNGILKKMREVKESSEIDLMKKAVSITCNAHEEMMRSTKPGMSEYQVQAIGEYIFSKSGSEYVGYPSICGSGENSCILHYETNRRTLHENDLILLDMGAEYHGYSADVTRTLPVNGVFTPQQKIIYDLVAQAQDSAFLKCKPGNDFRDTHKAAENVIKKGLLSLGIISKEEDYKTYFMHGTSHYLGLDVHDAGTYGKLFPGNVITIEPGIYIPVNSKCDPKWWNIGVRIEDDVLITNKGYENLSKSLPSKSNEIEEMMKKEPRFIVAPH